MFASFKSELIRFRRTGAIGGAIMISLSLLIALVLFIGIGNSGGGGGAGPVGPTSDMDLEASSGMVAGIQATASLVGILALALFALSVSKDFELGTVRVLLVAQPRRMILLGGKLLALTAIVGGAALLAATASIALSAGLAGPYDIDTTAWAFSDAPAGIINFAIGSAGWGLIGATLAMFTRSASTAITGGAAYLLIGENLIGLVWDNASLWLPAGVIDAFTRGGVAELSYVRSGVLLCMYLVVFVGAQLTIFQRRDIVD